MKRAALLLVLVLALLILGAKPIGDDSKTVAYTTPLATGVQLDPAGDVVDLGSMPLGVAIAPGGKRMAVALSGWRQQGVQIVDLESRRVLQTLPQEAAFAGAVFARDGKELYVSGGNDDSIFCYTWRDGVAAFDRKIRLAEKGADKPATRYPAEIAISPAGNYLYVVEDVSDDLAIVDLNTNQIVKRLPTDHYPYGITVAADRRVYVSAWGADTASIFQADSQGMLTPLGKMMVGPRPSALISNSSGSRLFVALATSDRVAVIDTSKKKVLRELDDSAPGSPAQGSTPNALALSQDESKLFVAEADNNAVAVFDVSDKHPSASKADVSNKPVGRIPSDWYPTAVRDLGGQLLVLTGKGHGSHANPDGPTPGQPLNRPFGYDLGQLNGTLRILSDTFSPTDLARFAQRVTAANGWDKKPVRRVYPPFKHVLYIIKENRTYDQVLGDLKEGDGDPNLVFFGQAVSPNHHGLALRFGLFDRFFVNAEVSSQGHIWSTAAYVTDYGEKLIPSSYSDRRGDVDGEDADEPLNGFLWTMAHKKGVSFRDYGEMVNGPMGWPVTQRGLGNDISPNFSPFNLKITDQTRADAWIAELKEFSRTGKMAQLEVMHLGADHTAGGRPGYRTPRAYMADNDLALGKIVEALSKSPFWRDTVVFVVEDDAQAGPDHVDSHRAPFYAISAYNRPGVIHRFVNTTDVVAAIEDILHLDRLSKFDYFSRSLADVFADTPDLSPWTALPSQTDLNETNPAQGTAAKLSEDLDFSAPDRVNEAVFNKILWLMMKGEQPPPAVIDRSQLHLVQIGGR